MSKVTAVVLGIMQDGGLPHIGCICDHCRIRTEYAACLAIVDKRGQPGARTAVWLLDATPDLKHQLNLLADDLGTHPNRPQRLRQPDGIFLTHAHMGHVGGLPQLGPEALDAQQLPVFASEQLIDLLQRNELWQPAINNLNLIALIPHQPITLAPDLHLTPLPVPHRDEWGVGTFAFHIQGPTKSLLYLPDIDAWNQWPDAKAIIKSVDYAFLDASFWSMDELNGRTAVAHPLVTDTLTHFAHLDTPIILTHLNHTNPLLNPNSPQARQIQPPHFQIAQTGQTFPL